MAGHRTELERRSFLSKLGAGVATLGAVLGVGTRSAEAQGTGGTSFVPARHTEDDWLDQVPGKHRLFMDTVTPGGIGQAIFFANNVFTGNRSYQLTDADVALVVCVRHQSTPFAYNDAMWAKYGAALAERAGGFTDPKTKQAPIINVYQAAGYGATLPNTGVLLDAVLKRGLRLAVCQLATRANAALAAQKTGGNADAIFKELSENLVTNARLVPAGIVAVNRAQERGYSFSYVA